MGMCTCCADTSLMFACGCGVQVHREMELVWDDAVTPEPAIDFEGASIATSQVLASVAAAFGSLFVLYKLVGAGDPEGSNPAVRLSF